MKKYDINPIVENIRKTVERHKLAPGSYARWLWINGWADRTLEQNPYGCADAANILYTINDFPRDLEERAAFVKNLQDMQGEDGLFHEMTHVPEHTTAHCIAALELFDAGVKAPCTALLHYKNIEDMQEMLAENARTGKYRGHYSAGIYVILNLTGEVSGDWNKAYFETLDKYADEVTGYWYTQKDQEFKNSIPHHCMGESFHYLFNYEASRMPIPYPDRLIDSCIELYDVPGLLPADFGKRARFFEMDWVYCLTRASRQTPYRFWEIRERLEAFWESHYDYLTHADWEMDDTLNDLHYLFGLVCTLAELQQTLKGQLISDKPLRLVLDRRPFI